MMIAWIVLFVVTIEPDSAMMSSEGPRRRQQERMIGMLDHNSS